MSFKESEVESRTAELLLQSADDRSQTTTYIVGAPSSNCLDFVVIILDRHDGKAAGCEIVFVLGQSLEPKVYLASLWMRLLQSNTALRSFVRISPA